MWDIDSYTKQWYEVPWEPPLMLDWVQEERHFTAPRNPLVNARYIYRTQSELHVVILISYSILF